MSVPALIGSVVLILCNLAELQVSDEFKQSHRQAENNELYWHAACSLWEKKKKKHLTLYIKLKVFAVPHFTFFLQYSLTTLFDVIVVERGQRGATTNDVALRFDDAKQVFHFMRADGSIMHVCFPLHAA